MAQALQLEPFLGQSDASCGAAWSFPAGPVNNCAPTHRATSSPGANRQFTDILAYLTLAPEKFNNLYNTYYLYQGLIYDDEASIAACDLSPLAPATALALIKDCFDFSISRIAEIFKVSRPTIYKWKNEGTSNKAILQKLHILQELGQHWKSKTQGQSLAWLLDYTGKDSHSLSIISSLSHDDLDLGGLKLRIDHELAGNAAATEQAEKILGKHGKLQSIDKPSPLSPAEQRRDALWSGVRERMSSREK